MSVRDKLLTFGVDQVVTASAASTSYKNEEVPINVPVGNDKYVEFTLTEDMTDSGSNSTVTPQLETDSDAGFATSLKTQQVFRAFPAGSLKGTKVKQRLAGWDQPWQYWRFYFTVAGGNLTTGKFTTEVVLSTQQSDVYPMAGEILS